MPLSWTPDPRDPEIFHITHVDNLPSIVADAGILCDAEMARRDTPTSIGDPSIKARRLAWTLNLPDAPKVGGFVPFYFCARSVMLYRVHRGHDGWSGGQAEVLHLVTRVSRVAHVGRCVFTDSSAATSYHHASDDLTSLATSVKWSVMAVEQWAGDAKAPRQAEFLVPSFVPWEGIERIICMAESIRQRVLAAIGSSQHRPLVRVDRSWYY